MREGICVRRAPPSSYWLQIFASVPLSVANKSAKRFRSPQDLQRTTHSAICEPRHGRLMCCRDSGTSTGSGQLHSEHNAVHTAANHRDDRCVRIVEFEFVGVCGDAFDGQLHRPKPERAGSHKTFRSGRKFRVGGAARVRLARAGFTTSRQDVGARSAFGQLLGQRGCCCYDGLAVVEHEQQAPVPGEGNDFGDLVVQR